MKDKSISIKNIIKLLNNDLITIKGEFSGKVVKYLRPTSKVDKYSLDWVNPSNSQKQAIAENSPAQVLLVDEEVIYSSKIKEQKKCLIYVPNPRFSIAYIGKELFLNKRTAGIHPTAIINPEAKLGDDVFVGAGCVIGKCIIGSNSYIYPNSTIYDNVIIGKKTIVHSGAVIGVDGLGCIRNNDGVLLEFPHLGGVTIGNNVYIGANTLIACGSLSQTVIDDGTKINGMCFIGHNCQLGKNTLITGSTMLAGSVKVDANTTIYSKVVIKEHINIGRNVILGMGAVVIEDVPDNEIWVGNPARKIKANV